MKKRNKRTVLFGGGSLLMCMCCGFAVLMYALGTDTGAAVVAQPSIETVAPTAISPPLNPAEALEAALGTVLGKGNRDVPRIVEFSVGEIEPGTVLVRWSINDNLTESMIRTGAQTDATDILRTVVQSGLEFQKVVEFGMFPIRDNFGNVEETMVVRMLFLRATVDRINWDEFLWSDIYDVADESFVGYGF